MNELTEKALEMDIDKLSKNPLVRVRIGNRCDRTEKGSVFIKHDRLYVVLSEDVESWQEIIVKAITLLGKVEQINEHNLNHPDLYQRVLYKINSGSNLNDCV